MVRTFKKILCLTACLLTTYLYSQVSYAPLILYKTMRNCFSTLYPSFLITILESENIKIVRNSTSSLKCSLRYLLLLLLPAPLHQF